MFPRKSGVALRSATAVQDRGLLTQRAQAIIRRTKADAAHRLVKVLGDDRWAAKKQNRRGEKLRAG
jgi:phage terminase large subunit GpA-like protein